jgi:L-amino acid N-acyltransferase YncA
LISIAKLEREHWSSVRRIYEEGIATGNATFETTAPDWRAFDESHLPACRFVASERGRVIGWAALSPVSGRCVYGGVTEVSVYIARECRGRGVGDDLLARLIEESERHGIWTLQAGIFPENEASIRLHKKHGFREVGRRTRIGQLHGRWRDVVLLERRSETVGTDEAEAAPPHGLDETNLPR